MNQKICQKIYQKLKDEKGQAMVEFAAMLPLFIIFILVMIIVYQVYHKTMLAQHNTRTELRQSMYENAEGAFQKVEMQERVSVDVPGKLSEMMNTDNISGTVSIQGYEGTYQGNGLSRYQTGKTQRLINY